MRRYARLEAVLVEPVGHLWAAYSPASGETTLLNDESAAVLEVLEQDGPLDSLGLCERIAADCGGDLPNLQALVEAAWPSLIDAGLVRCDGH